MKRTMNTLSKVGAGVLISFLTCFSALAQANRAEDILIDDFETSEVGEIPLLWWSIQGKNVVPLSPKMKEEGEYYSVESDGRGQFLRAGTKSESLRIVMPNNKGFQWNLESHPILSWRWRPNQLPPNAREDKVNDTAGSIYVTFGTDWLGRPKSLKYTYSTTLPVGTVIKQGPLVIVVVGSGPDGVGRWQSVRRDVAKDYREYFGRTAPSSPDFIAIWSDSDTTKSSSEMDFDDLKISRAN